MTISSFHKEIKNAVAITAKSTYLHDKVIISSTFTGREWVLIDMLLPYIDLVLQRLKVYDFGMLLNF